jgi:hypothetical protein
MATTAAWNTLTGLFRAAIRLSTVLATPTGSTTARSGVIPGGTPLLLTGSVMTGSVAPGRAIVQGTSAQGAYPVVVDAATPITVANGHASLSRIDTVWLVVLDTDYDSSGSRQASIVYQQGVAAGSPVAQTAPASGTAYLRLWDILVPANASSGTPINWGSALTDQRVYTVMVGGITPGAAAGSYAGQWRDAGGVAGILERYTGAAWEAAVRLGNSGVLGLGDVTLTRSATATMQVNGNLSVTGAGQWQTVVKSANQSVTSSTVLVNDTHLLLPLAANATYLLDGFIAYDGAFGAGEFKTDWTLPAGAALFWGLNGPTVGGGALYDSNSRNSGTVAAAGTYGTGGTRTSISPRGYITTGGTAGTLRLQWAQNASNATATTVYAGSWVRLLRIA